MLSEDPRRSHVSAAGHHRSPVVLAHEESFSIGDACFRPATREIAFAGQTKVIEPRVMQVLIALHRAGGAVVNKDDLIQSCWEGRIVGDDAINRVIGRLRNVASNGAGGQFRIETITKVGYRLVFATGVVMQAGSDEPSPGKASARQTAFYVRRHLVVTIAALAVLIMLIGAWTLFRTAPPTPHSMTVRLSKFQARSRDLPSNLAESIDAEIIAAFGIDGVVAVTEAGSSTPGTVPAYSLTGSIDRAGDVIRVISRLTNARTGVVLWSDSVDLTVDQGTKIPIKLAANLAIVVRCGLSGAATYRRTLPDQVLSNYMQYCQQYWSYGGSKTLRYAQLVVAAKPDFSWGWSAVGNGYMQVSFEEAEGEHVEAMRAAGRQAEDRALALDPNNSEALGHKAYLIDPRDWIGQESLFKRAIAAKPLDCGCEHYGYGLKLRAVGRLTAAVRQFRAAIDMLALWPDSQLAIASTLVATGQGEQATRYFVAAADLSRDQNSARMIAVTEGTETADYASALNALRSDRLQIPQESRAAFLSAYEALEANDSEAKLKAVQVLLDLPEGQRSRPFTTLLAALGARGEALRFAAQRPELFWLRSMRGVLNDPAFPVVAKQLGLLAYWRRSHTRPDVCQTHGEPPFCRMI